MQQGQFNMMKAQRDMQYQDQQRAQAAAAAARDKAAEAQAMALYGKTGAPGYQTYSPSMEPGAASDVGMLGGGQGYTEGAVNRLAMPAQPKNFDDAITTALQSGKFNPDVMRKLMALKETQNVYAKSNLGVQKETADVSKADLDRGAQALKYHASILPAVTQQTYAAWRELTVKALPGLDKLLPPEAPADPMQFEQLKRSLQAQASDSLNDHYEKTDQGLYAVNKATGKAAPVPGGEEITSKSTDKTTKLQQLQDRRDKLRADLEANPDDKNTQQALAEVTANINTEAKFAGAGQEEGKKSFDAALKDISDQYKKLGAQGMLITPESSIGNRAAGVLSDLAPGATTIVSPERAAPVAALKNLRENMKAAIIQASGGALTSKNFDSNAEAKSLLDSMSSPGQPLDAIVDTLNSLSRKYGTGNVLTAKDLTGGKEQNTSTGKSKPPLSSFAR